MKLLIFGSKTFSTARCQIFLIVFDPHDMCRTWILSCRPTPISIQHHQEQPSKGGLEQCPSSTVRLDSVSSYSPEEELLWSHQHGDELLAGGSGKAPLPGIENYVEST